MQQKISTNRMRLQGDEDGADYRRLCETLQREMQPFLMQSK